MSEVLVSLCYEGQYTTVGLEDFDLFSIEQAAEYFVQERDPRIVTKAGGVIQRRAPAPTSAADIEKKLLPHSEKTKRETKPLPIPERQVQSERRPLRYQPNAHQSTATPVYVFTPTHTRMPLPLPLGHKGIGQTPAPVPVSGVGHSSGLNQSPSKPTSTPKKKDVDVSLPSIRDAKGGRSIGKQESGSDFDGNSPTKDGPQASSSSGVDRKLHLYYVDAQTGGKRFLTKPEHVFHFQAHCLAYNKPLRLYIEGPEALPVAEPQPPKTISVTQEAPHVTPLALTVASAPPLGNTEPQAIAAPRPVAGVSTTVQDSNGEESEDAASTVSACGTARESLSTSGGPDDISSGHHSQSGKPPPSSVAQTTTHPDTPTAGSHREMSDAPPHSVPPLPIPIPLPVKGESTAQNSLSLNDSKTKSLTTPSATYLTASGRGPRPSGVVPLFGNWKKEKLLGAGADGKVYLAVDNSTQQQFAIKELLISDEVESSHKPMVPVPMGVAAPVADPSRKDTIRHQVEILQSLPRHPNVVQHTGVERTTCALIIMMEYVPGGTISSLLSKLGQFSEDVIRSYSKQVCTGLAFLHERGVIHRDVKGANIMIGLNNVAKLTDFGSCIINNVKGIRRGLDGLHGTSMWMSPESISKAETVNEKTDIWSLGCTIIEMATGKPPWHEARFTNEWAGMFYISQSGRGPPIPAHLSRQAHRFLQRCFAINPADRPSAKECLEDPFLAEEFVPNSEDPGMCPPSPSELLPLQNLPGGGAASSERESSPADDYATSTYSSIVSFAVYDSEWGNAPTDAPVNFADPSQADDTVGHQPFLPALPLAGGRRVDIRQAQHSDLRGSIEELPLGTPSMRSALRSTTDAAHLTPSHEVSNEAITGFLLEQATKPTTMTVANWVTVDDGYGFGLPEPVLYNVFHFLDSRSLCAVGSVSKGLQILVDEGAKEVLWRKLFISQFGELDDVRLALRKGWKAFYRDSLKFKNYILDHRFIFLRRLGDSANVFEGIDEMEPNGGEMKVIVKMEPIVTVTVGRRPKEVAGSPSVTSPSKNFSGLFHQGGMNSANSTFTEFSGLGGHSAGSFTSGGSANPNNLRTPTKNRVSSTSFTSAPSTPSSASKATTASPSTPSRAPSTVADPPTPVVSKMSMHTQSEARSPAPLPLPPRVQPGKGVFSPSGVSVTNPSLQTPTSSQGTASNPTGTPPALVPIQLSSPPMRGKLLPKTKIQRPMIPSSPQTRKGFGLASPGAGMPTRLMQMGEGSQPDMDRTLSGPTGQPGAPPTATASNSTVGSVSAPSRPPSTQALALGMGSFNRTNSLSNWSNLYEYTPVETSHHQQAVRQQRSLLLHAYKVNRHLEAMGVNCVPRVLHYSDQEVDGYHALVTNALGPSLHELVRYGGNQLSLKTAMKLTVKILRNIQALHEQGVVHGAISPSNIVMGTGSTMGETFLINFSHARFFRDPKNHRPITSTGGSAGLTGARPKNQEILAFCSTYVQKGCTPSQRDDIISLGYVLCFLVRGGLPWTAGDRRWTSEEVIAAKQEYMQTTATQTPVQLHHFLSAGYRMKMGDSPDIMYLTNLITRMMSDRGWTNDGEYDWTSRTVF